jgi:exonuclease VII large subunit
MSEKVDQFCDKLRDRLTAIEGRLKTVKTDIKSRSEEAGKAIRGKLDQVQTMLHAEKEKVDKLRANLKVRAEQKIAETKEAINEWKKKHEIHKLQARAERAEANAADAIAYALFSIDEAEEAILDAVVARMDAEAVKEPVMAGK